jgi:hypothetical protein
MMGVESNWLDFEEKPFYHSYKETAEKVPFRLLQKGNVKEPEYKTRLNTC